MYCALTMDFSLNKGKEDNQITGHQVEWLEQTDPNLMVGFFFKQFSLGWILETLVFLMKNLVLSDEYNIELV